MADILDLVDVQELGPRVDSFAGASGEDEARHLHTYGYPIRARKPE